MIGGERALRLDKYIADTGIASRREIAKAARAGKVSVNGAAVRVPDNKTPAKAIKYYKRVPGVLSAEMDKRAYLM